MFFYFNLDWSVDLFFRIGQFILSAITVWIAWRIFKNLDVRKEFKRKQFETVIKLAADLENSRFHITSWIGRKSYHCGIRLAEFKRTLNEDYKKEVFHSDVRIFIEMSSQYREKRDVFTEYVNHIYIPKKIADRLEKFEDKLHGLLVDGTEDVQLHNVDVIYLDIRNMAVNEKPRELEKRFYSETANDTYANLRTFMIEVIYLKSDIIDWLKDYGVDDINIKGVDKYYDFSPLVKF